MPPLPTTKPRGHWVSCGYRFVARNAGILMVALVVVAFSSSALALRGGALRPEEYFLLPHFLNAQKSVLTRVVDVAYTDSGAYQARELSHVFDLLNAQAIAWSVDHGFPHFLSIFHYLFCGAAIAFGWWFVRCRLHLTPLLTALLMAVFLTTPMVYFGASYFPTAKSGAAAALAACACGVAPAFSPRPSRVSRRAWFGTFLAALILGLFDRQGFFFALLVTAVLLTHALIARDRRMFLWASAPGLAVLSVEFYNRLLGPVLIEHFAGYRPSLEFQNIPFGDLWTDSGRLRDVLFYGPLIMLDQVRFLLGGAPLAASLGVLAAAVYWLGPRWPWPRDTVATWTSAQRSARGRLALALLLLSLAAMNGLMVLRMKAVAGLDFRRVYYGLPSVMLLTLALACAVAIVVRERLVLVRHVQLALFVIFVSNGAALIEHRQIIRSGLYRDSFSHSPELLDALKHLDSVPARDARPPYWPTFAQGQTTAAADGIVRFFRRRQLEQLKEPVAP